MADDGRFRQRPTMSISVTDRCNYRCRYCMPPGGVEYLDHSEIMRYRKYLSSAACSGNLE